MANASKEERFAVFLQRLADAPPASSSHEAFELLSKTLNEVEDELTDIPYQPRGYRTDGRMYPPQEDNVRSVPGRSDLVRYRSRAHSTYIRINGAIEIRDLSGRIVLSKAGFDADGVGLGDS